jgi:hypothetical protein
MKIICWLPLVLALAGCGERAPGKAEGTNDSASSPLTAPVDYLGAIGKAQQTAVKTIDITSIQQAIQMFHVDQGHFPQDLDELVTEKFMPRLPELPHGMKYSYDPATGNVKAVKQ